ncbi:MAG: 23S rRNA (guanosine(2251)-2'-O)-methyltransferase RlmB [Flavobacteriales bacterium]
MHQGNRKTASKASLIAGFRAVTEAVEAGKELDKVLIQKGLQGDLAKALRALLQQHGIPYQFVPPAKLSQLTRAHHQGVVAFLSEITFGRLDEVVQQCFESGTDPRIVMLDHVTDVRNFGAICRSAECFGVHAVVIPEKGAAQINAEAVKASAGALLALPVCREKDLVAALRKLRDSGLRIAACTEKGAQDLNHAALRGPLCVVLGAEDTGVSHEILRIADDLIRIPLSGRVSSLNVSVAAGIFFYQWAVDAHI